MSEEEQVNQRVPKQTEFTVQLPDRNYQFEKCLVIRPVTKEISSQVTTVTIDELGNRVSSSTASDTATQIDAAPVTKPVDDGQGKVVQQPITGAELEAVTEDIVRAATWGLGCPGGCGQFWEFRYDDMVPQVVTCPMCGAKITLV